MQDPLLLSLALEGSRMGRAGNESFWNLAASMGTELNSKDIDKSNGLPTSRASLYRQKNVISRDGAKVAFTRSLLSLANLFNLLLAVEAVLVLMKYIFYGRYWADIVYTVFFLLIILINWMMVFYKESSFGSHADYNSLLPSRCKVIRDSTLYEIDVWRLVPGDLVLIESGCVFPADMRIISNNGIRIQQSDLNGETDVIEGSARRIENEDNEIRHIIFAGSKCIEGSGKGLVLATGNETMLGQYARSSRSRDPEINSQLNRIVFIVIFLDLFTFVLAVIINREDWDDKYPDFVNISLGNIPQALTLTMTLCSLIVAYRLETKGVKVKRLEALERLSAISVVLCDKSGTLTNSSITVENFSIGQDIRPALQVEQTYSHSKELGNNNPLAVNKTWRMLFKTAVICNKAKKGEKGMEGSAFDQALLSFFAKIDPEATNHYKSKYSTRIHDIPFRSASKFEVTIRESFSGKQLLLMKGAPEIVLERCTHYLSGDRKFKLDARFRRKFTGNFDMFTRKAERVLATAYTKASSKAESDNQWKIEGLIFIGLISFKDGIRPGAPDAISALRGANVKVHIMTGDHVDTAGQLARNLGLFHEKAESEYGKNIFRGVEIKDLTDFDWKGITSKNEVLFARVSPENKVEIVRKLRELGERVMVVGKGANDALAMKEADVGIVFGESASSLSMKSADLVINSADLPLLFEVIAEGRTYFSILKKTISYILAHSMVEVVPCFLTAAISFPQAFSPILLLCIDMGTELLPAISLAFLTPNPSLVDPDPRNPRKASLVSWRLIVRAYLMVGAIELFWCFFAILMNFGFPKEVREACGVWFPDFGEDQFGRNYFNCSPRKEYRTCSTLDQKAVISQVRMAWFSTAVLSQFCNIFFLAGFRNKMTYLAVLIGIMILCLVIWVFQSDCNLSLWDFQFQYEFLFTPWLGSLLCLFLFYRMQGWTPSNPNRKRSKQISSGNSSSFDHEHQRPPLKAINEAQSFESEDNK